MKSAAMCKLSRPSLKSNKLDLENSGRSLTEGKVAVPTIINGPEVISSVSDEANLFAMNFDSSSTINDKGHPLS